jgi:choline dehydrogenase
MYDFIIVGAGSAGSVLANRLSLDPSVKVLVLEAGGSAKHLNVDTPVAFSKLFQTKRDWNYFTMPEGCCSNRQLYIPRGKMLGGSSSMNAMIYIRGHRADYDGWAAEGASGWAYDDVLPYFKKSEANERGSDDYHGADGPLNVADLTSPNELSLAFVEAAVQAGIRRNPDFNGANQEGAGLYQVTQKKAARWSTWKAFLQPAMGRENLTVLTDALVHRVLFDGTSAIGVEYSIGRNIEKALASEVVLAGGAVNTPQLLMLSGVGDGEHLRQKGIDVRVDNANVGRHLQDHPVILQIHSVTQPVSLAHAEEPAKLVEYLSRKKGMLSSNVGEAGLFVKTRDDLAAPDIQFHFAPGVFIRHGFETIEGDGMSFGPTLVAPKSRGSIKLRNADPTTHPDIETRALEHPDDVASLVAGFRMAREIVSQDALATYWGKEQIPGPSTAESEEEVVQFLRDRTELLYHPSCTARMGAGPDDAVVDPQLRVFGTEGLRVADASVMRSVVRGNTNAPTIMIAEKGADMLLAG